MEEKLEQALEYFLSKQEKERKIRGKQEKLYGYVEKWAQGES